MPPIFKFSNYLIFKLATMRRFKIASANTKGYIETMYDCDGKLCLISFRNIQLTANQIEWAKVHIPVQDIDCTDTMRRHKLVAEEVEFEVNWEDFKINYPPPSRNMHLAQAYWPKITSSDQYRCVVSLVEYRRYCARNPWYKPMMAEKYLKQKQWLNDWKRM